MANLKDLQLKIPNLGEAEATEVIEISVKVGDKVNMNDPIIVLESEKAAMEVPSDYQGTIKSLDIKEGDTVSEGKVYGIISVESDDKDKSEEPIATQSHEKENINAPLESSTNYKTEVSKFSGLIAGPAVRKIARELEIDLSKITGTGKHAMITVSDLKNFIHDNKSEDRYSYADLNILKEFGDFEVEHQSKIRKIGAKNLHNSWVSIPHVTHFEEIDITEVEKWRKNYAEKKSTKITPLAYLTASVSKALKKYPVFNSSLVGDGEVMVKKYINIGIAIDTEGGLVVPNIKDADKLTELEISEKIKDLADKAKKKKLLKTDFEGSTFSISSLGVLGGTGFTPIINPPEVAILSISRSKKVLCKNKEELFEKDILPIAISYDHRVINGADAGRFMVYLKETIESYSD